MNPTHTQSTSLQKKASILDPSQEGIHQAVQALLKDELVGLPTETVYGLAGNAYSQTALAKIFEVKERPVFDPLILHIAPEKAALAKLETALLVDCQRMTSVMKKTTERLMKKFWPGPLTLVLPKHSQVHDLATSGLPTVALRIPQHPVAQELLRQVQIPLAAPSANRFGRISPTTSQAVLAELGDRIPWILEGGFCAIGIESTILGFTPEGNLQLLRPGGIPKKDIEEALGKTLQVSHSKEIQAPGMLLSHYAPQKPLWLLSSSLAHAANAAELGAILSFLQPLSPQIPVGVLGFSGNPDILSVALTHLLKRPVLVRVLSQQGDLREAAQNLFQEIRKLDASAAHMILSEPCPSQAGLGHAITDRLHRAKKYPKNGPIDSIE